MKVKQANIPVFKNTEKSPVDSAQISTHHNPLQCRLSRTVCQRDVQAHLVTVLSMHSARQQSQGRAGGESPTCGPAMICHDTAPARSRFVFYRTRYLLLGSIVGQSHIMYINVMETDLHC